MNHLRITGLDARPTPYVTAHRTVRRALCTTVAAILLVHVWLYVALITFKK